MCCSKALLACNKCNYDRLSMHHCLYKGNILVLKCELLKSEL